MAILIYLNGKKEELVQDLSILQLLELKKIRPQIVTVELNGKIIEKDKYAEILLQTNDKLEFIYYMGGGSQMKHPALSDGPVFITMKHPALYPPHHTPTPPYRIGGCAATAAGMVGTPPSAAGWTMVFITMKEDICRSQIK